MRILSLGGYSMALVCCLAFTGALLGTVGLTAASIVMALIEAHR